MSEGTDIQAVETIDLLRLPDSMMARLPGRIQNRLRDEGVGGIQLSNRVMREIVTAERNEYFTHYYAEKNDARDRLTVDAIEPADVEEQDAVHLAGELEDLREQNERLKRRIDLLTAELAKPAMAVNSETRR